MERSLRPWDFFFSYSHKDLAIVTRYVDLWEEVGIRIWHDQRQIEYASEMHSTLRILDGIYNSHVFGLFYSDHTLTSQNVPQEFRSYLKRPIDFWGRYEMGEVFVFPLANSGGQAENFFGEKKGQGWWPSGGYTANISVLRNLENDESILAMGRTLANALDISHLYSEMQEVSENRGINAQRYWNWAKIQNLARWTTSMDMDAILHAFDSLVPPYDAWAPALPQSVAAAIEASVGQVARCRSKGVNAVALFGEAVVLSGLPGLSAYNHEGAKHISGEHLFKLPMRVFCDTASVGGLLDSLLALAIEGNFVDALQHAFYVARGKFTGSARDALDLTVLFAIGFMVDRWEDSTVMPNELVQKLVRLERISTNLR